MTDHYAALDVPRTATPEEIKRAVRVARAKAHPDRKGGDEAQIRTVNEAARILLSHDKRAEYDETGHNERAPPVDTQAQQEILAVMMVNIVKTRQGVLANIEESHRQDRAHEAPAEAIQKEARRQTLVHRWVL